MATLRGAVVHRSWLSLLAITVILLMIVFGTTPVEVRPLQGVEQAQVEQLAAQPAQPFDPAQGGQTPEILAPVAPAVVDYQVAWRNVGGSRWDPNDPYSALPTEEGFYDGEMPDSFSMGGDGTGKITTPPSKHALFVWRVLPQYDGVHAIRTATVRNGDVTLAWIVGQAYEWIGTGPNDDRSPWRWLPEFKHLLLSADGEESWCELNYQLPDEDIGSAVRLQIAGGLIRLYVRDSTVAGHWWEATVNRSELPCS